MAGEEVMVYVLVVVAGVDVVVRLPSGAVEPALQQLFCYMQACCSNGHASCIWVNDTFVRNICSCRDNNHAYGAYDVYNVHVPFLYVVHQQ